MTLAEATERLNQGRFSLEDDLFGLTVDPSVSPDVQSFLKALEAAVNRGDFTPEEEEEEDDDDKIEDPISRADAIEAIRAL